MTTYIEEIGLAANASALQPDVSRLTTKSVDGTGVFDVLMKATKEHIKEEYEADRITGKEYVTLYLGALTAVLQTSAQYLLNSQQEEQIRAEIGLLRQKTVTELAQTDDDIPEGLGFNGDTNVEGLVKLQKDKVTQEGELVTSQVNQSKAEVALTGQKVVTELARTCDNISQASVAGFGYNDTAVVEGLLKAEISKSEHEAELTEQKVVTELAATSDTKPSDLGKMAGTDITGVLAYQKDKMAAETTLLNQKANTELAQTADSVKTGAPYLNTTSSVTGVIKKQKDLYTAQTDGFARDAEQKAAKMFLDNLAVGMTQNTASAGTSNGMDDASIKTVVEKLKAGIGL